MQIKQTVKSGFMLFLCGVMSIACQSPSKSSDAQSSEQNPLLNSTPPQWNARGYNECEAESYQISHAKKLSARSYRFSVRPRYCSRRDLWLSILTPQGQEKLYKLDPNKDFSCFSKEVSFEKSGQYRYQICVKVESGYYPNLHPNSFTLQVP